MHLALLCVALQTPLQAQGTDALSQASAKLSAAQTLSGSIIVTFPGQKPQTWAFKFMKPNLYKIISPDQEFRSDGQLECVYLPVQKRFRVTERKGAQITDAPFSLGLDAFFPGSTPFSPSTAERTNLNKKDAIALRSVQPQFLNEVLYEDPNTSLPIGYDETISPGQILTVRYSDLAFGSPMQASAFAWNPPPGAQLLGALQAALAPATTAAPAPTLTDTSGTALNLASQFASHKATLIYFTNQQDNPAAAVLKIWATRFHEQGLEIVEVMFGGAKATGSYSFPVVLDAKSEFAKLYGVRSDAAFIVGPDGKIVTSFLGFDPDGIEKALRQRGFLGDD